MISTAALHAIGLGLGMLIADRHQTVARLLGLATAIGGAALVLG